jgi:hypothetical protein
MTSGLVSPEFPVKHRVRSGPAFPHRRPSREVLLAMTLAFGQRREPESELVVRWCGRRASLLGRGGESWAGGRCGVGGTDRPDRGECHRN